MDKEKFLLKRQLQHLKEIKGHGTEMISIYIPAEKAVADMSNKLRQELSQCVNIKSKQTQKAVESALTRLLHHLKTYGNATGKKGLALFCADDIYEVIPSEPIQVQMYKCGSSFELEPLERMLDVKKSYGLVLLDGRDASIARLRGTDLKVLDKLHSLAHSKHGHGGQSANRYARMREESIEVFYKRISESMDKQFLPDITEVIVGGPGPMKESFIKFKGYNYMFKILDCINTGYVEEQGFREMISKCEDIFANQEMFMERKLIEEFLTEIRDDGLVTYGLKNVKTALENKQVKTLIVSERSIDEFMELIKLAEEKKAEVVFVGTETSEGTQFLMSFGGIGAMLRYK